MEFIHDPHLNIKIRLMKLSINNPCHENWDAMTPNEKGAFCLSCQKTVVDFSQKSIEQIKDFFKEVPKTESVCGRFEEQQLTEMTFDNFFTEFKSWKYFQRAAVIVFFIFGFALFGCAQTNGHEIKMGKVAYVRPDTAKAECTKDTTHTKRPIKGKVKVANEKTLKKEKVQPKEPHLMGDVLYEENKK
jgi:hypothetical protein